MFQLLLNYVNEDLELIFVGTEMDRVALFGRGTWIAEVHGSLRCGCLLLFDGVDKGRDHVRRVEGEVCLVVRYCADDESGHEDEMKCRGNHEGHSVIAIDSLSRGMTVTIEKRSCVIVSI